MGKSDTLEVQQDSDCMTCQALSTTAQQKNPIAMLGWAHYSFKQILKHKAEEYSCKIIEVNESYTSKTCTNCGQIHNIGSKKVLNCQCGTKIDRDINGARNVFLKNIFLALKDSSTAKCCELQLVNSNVY